MLPIESKTLALALESVADPVTVTDLQGAILFVNDAFTRENGYLPSEILGKSPRALKSGQTPAETYQALWQAVVAGQTWQGEVVNRRKDGTCYLAELTVVPMLGPGRKPTCYVATHRNITAKRQAETGRQAYEESFRTVIEHSPDAMVVHRAGVVLFANRAAERLLGAERDGGLRGRALPPSLEARPDGRRGRVLVGAPQGGERELEVTLLPLAFEGGPATLQVMREVSGERQLAERMTLVDRQVALGALASGLGHELQGPLLFVINNLEVARSLLASAGAPARDAREAARARAQRLELDAAVADALQAAARMRAIVHDLAQLASAAEVDAGPLDVGAVVEQALELVSHSIAERARLVKRLQARQVPWGSPSRVSHVLLNLLHNAVQAIPPGDPPAHELRIASADEGDAVVLEVQDTGARLSAADLERLFDPRQDGLPGAQGRGLGLVAARSMAASMGGALSAFQAADGSTCFRLQLPVHPPPSRNADIFSRARPARVRVLYVDDDNAGYEELQRQLDGRATLGQAHEPSEALARLQGGESWDLILWDVSKAHLRGTSVFYELEAHRPEAARRVFFLAGDVAASSVQALLARFPSRRLPRPLSAAHVGELIEQLMNGALSFD